MKRNIFSIKENYGYKLKEQIQISSDNVKHQLHGQVSIFDKLKNGNLKLIDKSNMIVFSGREWLLERAFGSMLTDYNTLKSSYVISWAGVGVGGGEPGNPLQAGSTLPNDTDLKQPIRLRDDLLITDPGYTMYASRRIEGDPEPKHGYFKKFSSIVKKEDHANPFVISGNTYFPNLIAEIRIELSSDDCNLGSYQDINEAALFCSDPSLVDPGIVEDQPSSSSGSGDIPDYGVIAVEKDPNSYNTLYRLDSEDLSTNLTVGDTIWVGGTSTHNLIPEATPLLIIDLYRGTTGVNGYVICEKSDAVNETPTPGAMTAHFNDIVTPNYIMFSRVTFSTIRKTVDRELVFLWKIYF